MFENKEGQKVPNVTFHTRDKDQWVDVTTDDIFKGKKVVLFSLPGAFTPTCSSSHVPRYNYLAPAFKAQGVDSIVCVSVNDAFVMNSWKKDQDADNITFVPDGNGEFSEKMGLLVEKNAIGFGKRSWRYSMLVDNGVITKMFIEPVKDGDPFEVSDADTMLNYLAPNATKPQSITLITKPGCPFCAKARQLLDQKSLGYEEIVLGQDASAVSLLAITGKTATPQVFIDGKLIGGSDDLEAHLK